MSYALSFSATHPATLWAEAADAAEALVGGDDDGEAGRVGGLAAGVPFEGCHQGFVVGEAGGEAQHGFPGVAAAVAAG